MRQSRLFRLMPEAIDLRIDVVGDGSFHLDIRDRAAGVPWSDLEHDRYESLSIDELADVICAHISGSL